ncbi:hypothetical protein DFJ73DRAFT_899983, partial [Zopfochytrium polystomum]
SVRVAVAWVTYATSCSAGLHRLAATLRGAGIPLTVLGLHTPWRGWGQRLRAYHDHVASLPADTLVVVSDGEDVLLAPGCGAADLAERWMVLRGTTGGAVLLAAESALWPDEGLADEYNKPHVRGWTGGVPDRVWVGPGSPMRHLNAGTMMGRAEDVAALLRRIYQDDCADDQLSLTLAYLRPDVYWMSAGAGPANDDGQPTPEALRGGGLASSSTGSLAVVPHARPLLALDFETDLFVAMFNKTLADFTLDRTAGQLTFERTKGRPCILHQSGRKVENRILEELAREFGLKYDAKGIERARELAGGTKAG